MHNFLDNFLDPPDAISPTSLALPTPTPHSYLSFNLYYTLPFYVHVLLAIFHYKLCEGKTFTATCLTCNLHFTCLKATISL